MAITRALASGLARLMILDVGEQMLFFSTLAFHSAAASLTLVRSWHNC
jgi:hypothetical protein